MKNAARLAIGAALSVGLSLAAAKAGLLDKDRVLVDGQLYSAQNAGRAWSLNVQGNPPCLLRFELRAGDHWLRELPSQSSRVDRSEVQGPTDAQDPASFQGKTWTAYQFKLEPGPASVARWVVLGDWHVRPDPGDTGVMSSPWQLELLPGDILAFDMRVSAEKPVVSGAPARYLWKSPRPIARDVWHSLVSVADFDWRSNGEGGVTVWLDGVKIVEYQGPFGYRTARPPYFKFGIYRADSSETLAVDYANVDTARSSLEARIHNPPILCPVR